MTNPVRTTLVALTTILILGSSAAYAGHARGSNALESLLLNVAPTFLVSEAVQHAAHYSPQRSRNRREYHGRRDNSARGSNDRRSNWDSYDRMSFTSEPIRGGSSRRTRIIENPYPNRPVTGISFTGIERDAVHINDVITYPRKRLISHTGYSLSLYHPSQFLTTRGYVDYISVKAKRREYFTVTFHYD